MKYVINHVDCVPELIGNWEQECWKKADTLEITHFHDKSSKHHPKTQAKLLYDDVGIHGIFRVEDKYIICKNNGFMGAVHKDSCAEFFVMPKNSKGYFNFEFNCGGNLHCNFIVKENGKKEYSYFTKKNVEEVKIYHSLPKTIDTEIKENTTWFLQFFIPFSLIAKFTRNFTIKKHDKWKGNFYKCADESSHPHWGYFFPISKRNFHLPEEFQTIEFN